MLGIGNLSMDAKVYKVKARVWRYPGKAGWHFLTLPIKDAKKIKSLFGGVAGGFGSLPVRVTIGQTIWETSIFPESKSKSYVLPLKAEVREKENLKVDDMVNYEMELKI